VGVPVADGGSAPGGEVVEEPILAAVEPQGQPARESQPLAFESPADFCALDCLVGRWWVLHTRSRHEKCVAATFDRRGISYYLPLVTNQRTYGRKIVRFSVPLFPGYLFLCGTANDVEVAWKTNHVARVIHVEDQDRLCRELRDICRVVESGQPVDLYPSLKRGQRCWVKSGPLRGVEGVVVRRRNAWRMYISATVLGQSAAIEIDAAALEPVG
jgi:transcription antitermination factor NusG